MGKNASEIKVLVCDDSMMVRRKMKNTLNEYGISNVYEATNGEECVESFKQYMPDLTFMDIIMPVMTGIDALKAIKQVSSDAKVIMVTSMGTEGNLAEAIKRGATDFLQKPVKSNELVKLLDNYFEEA